MVVWFRHGSCTVGVEDGVVRAADFAALTTLLSAAEAVEVERQAAVDEARAQIEVWQAELRTRIDEELAAAVQAREHGHREGLKQGLEEAATQWVEDALRHAASTQEVLERQSQRLSSIVSMAVERIIEPEDRSTLFTRALRTITKLVKDVPLLTLRVPEADHDSARRAIDAVLNHVVNPPPIELVADATLRAGSCMFESDQGTVDASLSIQLAAIKRAIHRAADLSTAEGVPDGELVMDGPAPAWPGTSPDDDDLRADDTDSDDSRVPLMDRY